MNWAHHLAVPSGGSDPIEATSTKPISVLLVEDNPGDARLVELAIEETMRNVLIQDRASTLGAALDQVAVTTYDLVLLDLSLPDSSGIDTVNAMIGAAPNATVIVLTGQDDQELAMQALRVGAQDYVLKGRYDADIFARIVLFSLSRKELLLEQKLAADRLEESEGRFRNAFDSSAIAKAVWGIDGGFLQVNRAACEMLGYTKDEIVSQDWKRLVHPDEFARLRPVLRDLARGFVDTCRIDLKIRHRDGRFLEGDAVFAVANDAAGRPQCVIGEFDDVTEERRAQKRLKTSEERYRLLFERNPAGVFRAALDNSSRVCNEALAKMFGYGSPRDLVADPPEALYESPAERQELVDRLLNDGQIFNEEVRFQRVDGRPLWTLLSCSLIEEDGQQFFEGTMVDITDRKQAEQRLLHSQRVEAVGRLASGVAHDFNNLLQAFSGLAVDLVSNGNQGGLSSETAEELENLVRSGAQLTRQLLLFSKPQRFEPEDLDLNEVLRGTEKMLRRLIRENIQIDLELDDRALAIRSDRGHLEQVVVNLAVNAQDAMPKGGRLGIRTALTDDQTILLEIDDSGEGMSEAVLEKIFDPFFTTKEKGKGTGLGLSVVGDIVNRYGGTIDVDSRPNEGTTFRITFPILDGAEIDSRPEVANVVGSTCGSGERVLVVEDESGVRRVIERALGKLGYEVRTAATVSDGLQEIEASGCDLLITDMVLPDGEGLDVARFMHETNPGTPVILMSGYSKDSIGTTGLPESSISFLHKPFSMDLLGENVRQRLDGAPSVDGRS